ncbi:MAG: hypothetical protein COS85_11550 [Armatimonadetes bacterium CG07_land_8_20_14_0_80_59_28]|nr:MAG: hypothetical protein COS85_11550 [Armatimonadetes bacterium CG07_land_8_20_14_0_80_59_28]PIX43486.1 MAG: hypothetical protein COZ56_07040 [Armatimonadetes bacterium CG_4_8_14_3_um_filter_58_9]PIY42838.1 MAG: hypothetical protein COZ05_12790 [Armatimonadetes bacterium CG_4_10_14_3_um_filter_59_10]
MDQTVECLSFLIEKYPQSRRAADAVCSLTSLLIAKDKIPRALGIVTQTIKRAGDKSRSSQLWEIAGHLQMAQYDMQAAYDAWNRAIESAGDVEKKEAIVARLMYTFNCVRKRHLARLNLQAWPKEKIPSDLQRYLEGLAYRHEGNNVAAKAAFTQLTQDTPRSLFAPEAWVERGDIDRESERAADSRKCYQFVLDHYPLHQETVSRASLHMAYAYGAEKRYDEAHAILARLAKTTTDSGLKCAALLEDGTYYYREGKHELSIPIVQQALEIGHPDRLIQMKIHYQLGSSYLCLKQWKEGAENLKAGLDLISPAAPGSGRYQYRTRMLYRLMRAYQNLGDFDTATIYLKQYLDETRDDTTPEARDNTGVFSRLLEVMKERLRVEGTKDGLLALGSLSPGKIIPTTLKILKPWCIETEISCNLAYIKARVWRGEWVDGYTYRQEVQIQVTPDAPKGSFRGQLVFTGKEPVGGRATVVIQGEVV